MGNNKSAEKVAAGGVVIDDCDSPRVLVVHRPRYDDWSFPKGKLDRGETIEGAALREVKEETGVDCRIVRELSIIRYSYRTLSGEVRPKIVHYFLMEPVGGDITVDGQEVDAVEWVNTDEAGSLLSYDHDKELLVSVVESIKGGS